MVDLKANKKDVKVPRYDKSLRAGKGDRARQSEWDIVNDVDIILFEGWMLGFDPKDNITAQDGDISAVNAYVDNMGRISMPSLLTYGWYSEGRISIPSLLHYKLDDSCERSGVALSYPVTCDRCERSA